jgi:hypothetical protein
MEIRREQSGIEKRLVAWQPKIEITTPPLCEPPPIQPIDEIEEEAARSLRHMLPMHSDGVTNMLVGGESDTWTNKSQDETVENALRSQKNF